MTPEDQYWAFIASGQLKLQVCEQCRNWQFPPATRCRECLSQQFEWREPSGRGTVWSWIRMHKPYFNRFADRVPYPVLMVRLAEGPRLIAGIVGPEANVRCEAQVQAVFERNEDGVFSLAFQIVGDE